MELDITGERAQTIKTRDSAMRSCNRISDSECDESVGGNREGFVRRLVLCALGFYVHRSVHLESMSKLSNKMQLYTFFYISANCSTCFG